MIDAVLFDLDGTLINTNQLVIESFKHVFKNHLNMNVEESEIVKYFGEPLITTMERYDRKNAEFLFKAYIEYNEMMHDSMVKAFEGAHDTILALKKIGIKVGVVSSKRRKMVDRGLRVCGLEDIMDVIITPEDTSKHKPEPEPVLKACEKLNISPADALMVGDSHFDIMCGKNAGAKTCLVKYTAVPMEGLMNYSPDYLIDKLYDIVGILDGKAMTGM